VIGLPWRSIIQVLTEVGVANLLNFSERATELALVTNVRLIVIRQVTPLSYSRGHPVMQCIARRTRLSICTQPTLNLISKPDYLFSLTSFQVLTLSSILIISVQLVLV